MVYEVAKVHAIEILDSRGRPTLEVSLELASGPRAVAGVPSGASTGTREAVELRDGDPKRYKGAGVTKAVANVNGEINSLLAGRAWKSLEELDGAVIELDGTETKSRLGANATVGVSMAAARAMALADDKPLYRWLAPDESLLRLPVPHFNVVNGGAHAQNDLEFQEFMLAPLGAPNFAEALRAGAEVYQALRGLLHAAKHSTGLGDEGGFAPNVGTPEEVLDLLVAAITAAGYTPGRDGIAIALDPASSEMREIDGSYRYSPGVRYTTDQMIDRYQALTSEYPIWSIEDGLGRGRLGRMGQSYRPAGPDRAARRRRPVRHQPGHNPPGHRASSGQFGAHKAEPDRYGERDPGGHCRMPGGRLYAVHFPPFGRDDGHLYRRPGRRQWCRPDEDGRAGPGRAGGQVQPPGGHRSRGARPALRGTAPGLGALPPQPLAGPQQRAGRFQ